MSLKTKFALYSLCVVTLVYGLLTWNYVSMGVGIVSLAVAERD